MIVIQSFIILIGGQLNIIRVDRLIQQREYEYDRKDMLVVQDAYNHKLKQIRTNVLSLFFDSTQSESILEKIKRYKGTTKAEDLTLQAEIQQFLQSMAYTDESIRSILFVRNSDEQKFAFVRYFDPSLLPNFESMISLKEDEFVKVYPVDASPTKQVLIFILKVNDPNTVGMKQTVGNLVVSIDTGFLQIEGDPLHADSIIELKNSNGTIRMSGNSFAADISQIDLDARKHDSKDYFVTQVDNTVDDMVFTMLISKKQLKQSLFAMKKNQWMTIVAIVFLNVFIAFYISRALSKRVNTVTRNMRKYTPGEFVNPILIQKQDEFTVLEETYNQLILKLSEFIQKEYVMEIKSKEAELQLLHSQVNPHFLSNMLEILRMQAIKENNLNLSDTIYQLSEIFRWNIRNKETVVTLYEELYYIEYYLKLQQFRFPKLQFRIVLPQNLQNQRIVKFSVQPIVENVFKHAMNKGKETDIHIQVIEAYDSIRVSVKDNGKGMVADDLDLLILKMQKPLADTKDTPSVGLMNVHARLQLIFGEPHGLEVQSQIGEGTKVILHIPKNEVGP
ncbi:sensor histidine kinase [Cohnella endophytica]|uniref:sensor histidine kinase n=1 Tax=Cohnella endophytica TaxID=2419778 RepID=UPI0011C488EC|nr:histidine kinase [Cohnella endophytica]